MYSNSPLLRHKKSFFQRQEYVLTTAQEKYKNREKRKVSSLVFSFLLTLPSALVKKFIMGVVLSKKPAIIPTSFLWLVRECK
jgi:hypothetical protein